MFTVYLQHGDELSHQLFKDRECAAQFADKAEAVEVWLIEDGKTLYHKYDGRKKK